MQDRVPLYPGRVTLTPVSGQANTFDLVRADQPTQEGTPLNKANLLKDTTAALFGLGTDAVPDDALALLSRFHKGLGNEYVWSKTKSNEEIIQIGNTKSYWVGPSQEVQYSSDVYIDNGTIKLRNPVTSTFGSLGNGIVSKYFYANFDTSKIRFCTSLNVGSSSSECFYKDLDVNTITTFYGYVNSPDPNAYPPAVSDGYTYTALGQLGAKVQIETGSYVGTGINIASLTFDFTPKIVIIAGGRTDYNVGTFPYIWGDTVLRLQYANYSKLCNVTIDGTQMNWINPENDVDFALNYSGITYRYIAIG